MIKGNRTRFAAQYGMMVALALIVSYAESQIPSFFAIPGLKPGLTNIVVLFALYAMGDKSGLLVNFIRIFLVSVLFGNGISWAYSAAGGLLSGLVMLGLKKTGKFRIVTVSCIGGIAHNVGQILVAMVLLETKAVAWYLAVLWFTGLLSGILVGVLGGELVRRLAPLFQKGVNTR